MEPPAELNVTDDLLAALEPPGGVQQYWLSEEELRAITCVTLHPKASALCPAVWPPSDAPFRADPDLGAAFGNPYIPPAAIANPQFALHAQQIMAADSGSFVRGVRAMLTVGAGSDSPVASPAAASTPTDPQSPTSASSASGSGEDDGSEERAAAAGAGKRRRTGDEKDIDLAFLGISKAQLQSISSKQFDDTVARVLASGRKFTADERKAVTAARRRIKNREYARDMRVNQSRQMTELAGRVTDLEAENHALRSQVAALQHENALLKGQLGGAPTPGVYQPPTAAPRSVLGKRSTPQVAAGACLLVLLLSFGFYFNFTSPTPFDATLQGRSGVSTGRVLLHQAEPATWSFVGALQRAVFAWRYGGASAASCSCEEQFRGLVCVDKDEFRELGRRCDLSGITKHEE